MPSHLTVDLKTPRPPRPLGGSRPPRPSNILRKLRWIFGFQRPDSSDMPRPTIRPMEAADIGRLREFVQGLSPRTAYHRLLSTRMPTEGDIRRWTGADGVRELAVIATEGSGSEERIVGVARYALGEAKVAEFAIVLADARQGRGVGRELLGRLIDCARERGVKRLHGVALGTNTRMLLLGRRLGFRLRKSPEAASLTALDLTLAR